MHLITKYALQYFCNCSYEQITRNAAVSHSRRREVFIHTAPSTTRHLEFKGPPNYRGGMYCDQVENKTMQISIIEKAQFQAENTGFL